MRQISSVKSRSSSSTAASDPKQRIRDCCRNFVAFMCTQVGVGALIVGYALIGAAGFQSIETQKQVGVVSYMDQVKSLRHNYSVKLWGVTAHYNVLNKGAWAHNATDLMQAYQTDFVELVKKGYDGRTPEETWTFAAALMYCMSVFSMIGYGNRVPKTDWGKGATMIYATFGIPLYILYFLNIGRVLARTFKWLYTWIHECSHEVVDATATDDEESTVSQVAVPKKVIVPSTAGLWVIFIYVATGTIMFAEWEDGWGYLNSVYFCVTSLCKIGFGDFTPGHKDMDPTKLAINFVYMLFGMGLVAMCFNLMREEVREKMAEMREDMRLCFEDIQKRFTGCCGGGSGGSVEKRGRRKKRDRYY